MGLWAEKKIEIGTSDEEKNGKSAFSNREFTYSNIVCISMPMRIFEVHCNWVL